MSIQTKQTPAGPRFDVVYRPAPGARQVRERFASKREAERRWAEVQTDIRRGQHIDQRNPVTVTEFARQYVAARDLRDSSRTRMLSFVANHIEPAALGGRRIVGVKPTEVQSWATGLSRTLAPSTARYGVRLIKAMFAAAVYDQVVTRNPAERVRLERHEPDERVVPLTVEQVEALAAAMHERYRAVAILQAATGLRISEALGLVLDDVDFLRRTVTVSGQLLRGRRVPPKSRHAHRTVPIPSAALDALAAHLAKWPAHRDGWVFTTSRKGPVAQQTYADAIAQAVTKAGLPSTTTSHDLRHHFASLLVFAGTDPVTVAAMLGHSSPALVLSTYAHLWPDAEDRTRKILEAAWGRHDEAASVTPLARSST